MTTPRIQGNTIFMGDSITVGLPPFVNVEGKKSKLALGGKTADWLLARTKELERAGGFDGPDRPVNAVVLIGTNDVGGSRSAEQIFKDTSSVWDILKAHGLRVVASTVPPFKGYTGYAGRYAAIEAKRKTLNTMIVASPVPDLVLRIDQLVADPDDPERLARRYDEGDHLHLQKPAHGVLIQSLVAGALPRPAGPATPEPSPAPPALPGAVATRPGSLMPLFVLGFLAAGGIFILTRKAARPAQTT